MTVTIDVLEQVKAELIAADLSPVGVGQLIRTAQTRERVASDPNRELAEALRNAYYSDGLDRPLYQSTNPDQWLRMAGAAQEFLLKDPAAEFKPGDRVKIVGPHVTAKGQAQWVRGTYGIVQAPEDVHEGSVHLIDQDGEGAHCWLDPASLELDSKAPRVFQRGDVIPDDVKMVMLAPNSSIYDRAVRTKDGNWLYASPALQDEYVEYASGWETFEPSDYPLTEAIIVEEKTEDAATDPRVFHSLTDVPEDVEVIDRQGDHWKVKDGTWHFDTEGDGDWFSAGHRDSTEDDGYAPFTEVLL